jgi:putative nucleotidyltransferase with HDIG domain
MAFTNEIVKKASEHVQNLLREKLPPWSVYHSVEHTREVVAACEEIGQASKLNKSDLEIVLLAAWFHDTGYTEAVEGHEEVSVEILRRYLVDQNYPQTKLEQAAECILVTKVSAQPLTLPEKVMRDADMLHMGRKSFFAKSDLLRLEMEKRQGKTYSDLEWLRTNLEFIARNQFYTEYTRAEYGKRREKNLLTLQNLIRDAEERSGENYSSGGGGGKGEGKRNKQNRPDRGIETMFRVVPSNHLQLSAIADNKANLMLSTNSIIVSIVFGLLISKLDTNPHLVIPTFLLLSVCLTAIIFAILATRPKVTTGTFTRQDIIERKVNLLFFGNFHSVPLEDFEWGMNEMMNDREYLYGSMIKDLYYLGQVLERKYRYLRMCYNVFMFGLIAAVIAFGISFLFVPAIME